MGFAVFACIWCLHLVILARDFGYWLCFWVFGCCELGLILLVIVWCLMPFGGFGFPTFSGFSGWSAYRSFWFRWILGVFYTHEFSGFSFGFWFGFAVTCVPAFAVGLCNTEWLSFFDFRGYLLLPI